MDIQRDDRNLSDTFALRLKQEGGADFAMALGEARDQGPRPEKDGKGQPSEQLQRKEAAFAQEPVSDEEVAKLGRTQPGVLPMKDRRSAQEIIRDTPALANLRDVHKHMLNTMIPGYESDPEAAFHAAAVITHIKNFDENGNRVKDRAKAENAMVDGFKSWDSINTHKNTEARRFENFIRRGYGTLKGGEEIKPFMPSTETRSAQDIIAANPFLSSLAPGETQEMIEAIIPGYRSDAAAAFHADRVFRHLEHHNGKGVFVGDPSEDHKVHRLEAFVNHSYDAVHGYDTSREGLEAHDGEATLQRREETRERLTEQARDAAEDFDKERYDALAAAGADENAVPWKGPREALGDAVRAGDMREVERLLTSGKVAANVTDDQGRTVLFDLAQTPVTFAGGSEPRQMLRLLLASGLDMTKLDGAGGSALEALYDAAVIRGPYQIGDAQQRRAAAIRATANDLQAWLTSNLKEALKGNDQARAVALIEAGADGGAGLYGAARPSQDVSILQYVIGTGQREVFDAILASKPEGAIKDLINEVWADGNTALHAAAAANQPQMAEQLKRLGADESILNDAGRTPDEVLAHLGDHLEKRNLALMLEGTTNLAELLEVGAVGGPVLMGALAVAGLAFFAYSIWSHSRPVMEAASPAGPSSSVFEGPTRLPPTTVLPGPTSQPMPTGIITLTDAALRDFMNGGRDPALRPYDAFARLNRLFHSERRARVVLSNPETVMGHYYLVLTNNIEHAQQVWRDNYQPDVPLRGQRFERLAEVLDHLTPYQRDGFFTSIMPESPLAMPQRARERAQIRASSLINIGPNIRGFSNEQMQTMVDAALGEGRRSLRLNESSRPEAVANLAAHITLLPRAQRTRLFDHALGAPEQNRAIYLRFMAPQFHLMDTGERQRFVRAVRDTRVHDEMQTTLDSLIGQQLSTEETRMLATDIRGRIEDLRGNNEPLMVGYYDLLSRIYSYMPTGQRAAYLTRIDQLRAANQLSPEDFAIIRFRIAEFLPEDERTQAISAFLDLAPDVLADEIAAQGARFLGILPDDLQLFVLNRAGSTPQIADVLRGLLENDELDTLGNEVWFRFASTVWSLPDVATRLDLIEQYLNRGQAFGTVEIRNLEQLISDIPHMPAMPESERQELLRTAEFLLERVLARAPAPPPYE